MNNVNNSKISIDEYQLLQYILSSSKDKHIAYILQRLIKLKNMVMQHD